jgi:dipeptidyl aminopeptidase/acylaminoacyl peptidase
MRRAIVFATLASTICLSFTLGAQSKAPITRADYGQWETLSAGGGGGRGGGGGGGGFSPDGRWLTYSISRQNQANDLRLLKLADNTLTTIPFGSQLAFTSDSKWAGYSVGYSDAEQERMRTAQRPIQNKLALLNLATGETSTVDGIQSFTFSPDGAYVAMRLYSPAAPAAAAGAAAPARGGGGGGGARGGGRGGADSADEPVGASIIVRQLATGRDTTFGNVGEFAWQDAERAHLLAMAISADGKNGNGVQLFDPETTVLRVLESSATAYTGLVWRKDSVDLALLRAKTDARKDGPSQAVLAWTGIGKTERLRVYDATADSTFPAGMRTVSFRRLSWSEDGNTLFLGIAKWDDLPPPPAGRGRGAGPAAGRGAGAGAGGADAAAGTTPPPDEPATVTVWHWTDVAVQPRQKLSAAADRRRNLLAAWHLDSNRFVQLGKSYDESVTPMRHSNTAYVAEWSAYAMDRSIGRPAANLYLEDMTTGARTKLKENLNDRDAELGPAGKILLYLQDDNFFTMNLATRTVTNLSKGVPTSFVDKESDATVRQKPDFGVAGWTKDDAAVLLYDKFDIWKVPTDGTKAQRLTSGADDQVRHRLLRVGQDEEWIDLSKPVYVSLFGTWSKKFGYGLLTTATGAAGVDRLIWLDQSVGNLAKAREADVYSYVAQNYDDSPDLFVGGADLKTAKQVTHTNEFQSKYAWGRSETVDFTTDKGMKLQGSLYYPAGYEVGRKYPMIVYIYEKLSDGVHSYVVPSDKSYYNISVFMSQGYFVFEPDIVFRPRQPGLSVVECVTAGVKKVAAMGPVDPKRVGVIGHSWGGFDTVFLATHTTGVFAGAVAGAPITDLVSNYGNHHWSSGIAETDHIETGQQRMEVPLYEDLPDYIANSAVFNAANMTVPLMIEVGDADGTVFWHQGVELYNIARRAKKNVVLLQYEGEDHALRQAKNQIDYQRRILEWFGHYLKGEEGPSWITKGTSEYRH